MRLMGKISFLNLWSKIALQEGIIKPRTLLTQTYNFPFVVSSDFQFFWVRIVFFKVLSSKPFFSVEKIDVDRLLWLLDMTTLAARTNLIFLFGISSFFTNKLVKLLQK